MIRNHKQEGLSRAYIHAVAAACGMTLSLPNPDYGIDLTLNEIVSSDSHWFESGYKIDIQAKSTTHADLEPEAVRYDLDVKSYDILRYPKVSSPRLLVVLVMPADESEWLSLSEQALQLRHCAYWLNLEGRPRVQNRRTIRLRIPRTNVFSSENLQELVRRMKTGESL